MKNIGFVCVSWLMFMSSCKQVTQLVPLKIDQFLGKTYAAQFQNSVYGDPILDSVKYHNAYAYLYDMVQSIKQSSYIRYQNQFPYQIKIVHNDSIINAFCIPGGYIYVYTGLIRFLNSDAELAGVLAHEIAHAELRHSLHQLISSQLLRLGIAFFIGTDPGFLVTLLENMLQLSFSRADETEADTYALYYINDTPYHPLGIQGFFKKIQSKEKDARIAAFLSTHPTSEDRYSHIATVWRETGAKVGEMGSASYAQFVKTLPKK